MELLRRRVSAGTKRVDALRYIIVISAFCMNWIVYEYIKLVALSYRDQSLSNLVVMLSLAWGRTRYDTRQISPHSVI